MAISFEQALALCRSDPEAAARLNGQRLLAAVDDLEHRLDRRDETAPAAFQRAREQARDRILEMALGDVPSRLDADGKELKREAFNWEI